MITATSSTVGALNLPARSPNAGSCHTCIPLSRATPSSLWISAEDVLGYVLAHPESSFRDISKACSYSKSTVGNILHTYGAYPFHPVLAEELMPVDQEHCFDFCNFVLNTPDGNQDFFNEVLWSDECQFSRQGTINTYNTHYLSLGNPNLVRPNRHLVRWSVNECCGIWKSTLNGHTIMEFSSKTTVPFTSSGCLLADWMNRPLTFLS
ncbi:uncharacterized protein TNCV_1327591 [Trichonephila clavipes]|nr:uncharacterized protein TNCV_1327591 [Trichonephila clavipes]